MIKSNSFLKNETLRWSIRITILIIVSVFLDTLFRLRRMENEMQRDRLDHIDHDTLTDLQYKTKLFYTHRNMYLSMFSLFMVVVLSRRMADIYQHLTDTDIILEMKKEILEFKDERLKMKFNISDSTTKSQSKQPIEQRKNI